MESEFDLIAALVERLPPPGEAVRVGSGDDAAVTEPRAGADQSLALETGEALFDIRGILGALLLAIIDHVQTNGDLLLYDIDYRSADALRKGSLI